MNKRNFFSCAVMLATVTWITLYFSDSDAERTLADKQPEAETVYAQEPRKNSLFYESMNLFLSLMSTIEDQVEDIDIFSDEKLNETGAVINKCMRYLSRDKAIEHFRTSGLDTVKNYYALRAQLLKPYEAEPNRDLLRQRVTALRFLEMSQHLNSTDCLFLLEQFVATLGQQPNEQLERNSRLDLYEISQVCGRLDKGVTASFAHHTDNIMARNTILLGLEKVGYD